MHANNVPTDLAKQIFKHYLNSDFDIVRALHKQIASEKGQDKEGLFDSSIMYALGLCYSAAAEYGKAEECFDKSKLAIENELDLDHFQLALILRNLANVSQIKGDNEKANKLYHWAMEIWEEYLSLANSNQPVDLNDFDALFGQKSEDEQIKSMHTAARHKANQAAFYDVHEMPFAAAAMYELAVLYQSKGRYKTSEKLLAIALQETAANGVPAAIILQQWAQLSCLVRNYGKAINLYRQAIALFQNHELNNHPFLPELYHGLARALISSGSYDEANQLLVKAQRTLESNIGSHPYYAYILKEFAHLNKIQGNYLKAEMQYKHALEILAGAFGTGYHDQVFILDDLADLYQEQKKYKQAEELWFSAINISGSDQEQRRAAVAKFYDRLACLYKKQNQHLKAEYIYHRVLRIRQEALSRCQNEIADTHINLAQCYLDGCKFLDAEKCFRSTLELVSGLYGEKSDYVIRCREGLGIAYLSQGKIREAELVLKQVLHDHDQAPTEKQIRLVPTLIALGEIYAIHCKYEQAKNKYKQALEIIKENYGSKSRELVPVLNKIAEVSILENDMNEAIISYEQVLKILEMSDYQNHVDSAAALTSLGTLYDELNYKEKADQLFDAALKIINEHLEESSEEAIIALLRLAKHCQIGDSKRNALLYCKQALKAGEDDFGSQHPIVVKALTQLGQLYIAENNFSKAREMYIRALPIMESRLGGEHLDLASALIDLARVHVGQGNYQDAEPLLRRGLAIREESLGLKHPATLTATKDLSDLCCWLSKHGEAKQLKDRMQLA